jgi:hypothetical protein
MSWHINISIRESVGGKDRVITDDRLRFRDQDHDLELIEGRASIRRSGGVRR